MLLTYIGCITGPTNNTDAPFNLYNTYCWSAIHQLGIENKYDFKELLLKNYEKIVLNKETNN